MNCQNCQIEVSAAFAYAIQLNQCPGCGEKIMPQDKILALMNLTELLKTNFEDYDCEKIASLIVANFDLKQLFKQSKVSTDKPKTSTAMAKVKKPDAAEEAYATAEESERARIKKIRDAEYEKARFEHAIKDALDPNASPGVSVEVLEDFDDTPGTAEHITTDIGDDVLARLGGLGNYALPKKPISAELDIAAKQEASREAVLSGGGSFRRSS